MILSTLKNKDDIQNNQRKRYTYKMYNVKCMKFYKNQDLYRDKDDVWKNLSNNFLFYKVILYIISVNVKCISRRIKVWHKDRQNDP